MSTKPDNTITKPFNGLSFVTKTTTKRGRWIGINYFDVPATPDHFETTDLMVFAEMMKSIKSGDAKYQTLARDMVIDASRAWHSDPSKGPTRKWVAAGFLNLINAAVRFSATAADWDTFIAARMEQATQAKILNEKQERERMEELTRKSAQARRQRKLENTFNALLSCGKLALNPENPLTSAVTS